MAGRPGAMAGYTSSGDALPVYANEPSDTALRLATRLSERVGARPARVRFGFVRRLEGEGPPPLAGLLRGGRGGEVRLKLVLSLLWVAGGGDERHATGAWPARAWAALLDLPDPEGNGQRRIHDAIRWLEEKNLIRVVRQPGKPMSLQLLLEDGSGKPYFDPAPHARKKKESNEHVEPCELFFQMPPSFWTDGWIVRLSGRALTMLLVLSEVTFSGGWRWVSPSQARQKYGISEDTWSRGVAELKRHKIIDIRKKPVGEEEFDFRRVRNTYLLRFDQERRVALPTPPAREPANEEIEE